MIINLPYLKIKNGLREHRIEYLFYSTTLKVRCFQFFISGCCRKDLVKLHQFFLVSILVENKGYPLEPIVNKSFKVQEYCDPKEDIHIHMTIFFDALIGFVNSDINIVFYTLEEIFLERHGIITGYILAE